MKLRGGRRRAESVGWGKDFYSFGPTALAKRRQSSWPERITRPLGDLKEGGAENESGPGHEKRRKVSLKISDEIVIYAPPSIEEKRKNKPSEFERAMEALNKVELKLVRAQEANERAEKPNPIRRRQIKAQLGTLEHQKKTLEEAVKRR